jgi:tetratricopeptide (TPR) repeat protein
MTRRLLDLLLIVALVFWATPASAQERDVDREAAAQARDERATALFQTGDYAGALAEMQAAQEILPATPRVYNMAVCHERLGHQEEAIALYQRFIDLQDAQADRVRRAQERLGELDRQPAVPDLGSEVHAAQEPDRPPRVAPPEVAPPRVAPPQVAPSRRRLRPVVFYALLGSTLAIAATATVTGAVALDWHFEHDELGAGSNRRSELEQKGPPLAYATDGLIAVAAAGAVATLVVGLLTDFHGHDGAAPTAGRVRLVLGATGVGLSCALGWSF